jgi:O-antigen/teichoic acid export membrane protein
VTGRDPEAPAPTRVHDARLMARGSAALAVGQTLARVVAFGFLLVATRRLTPNEFGRYSIVAALVLLVQIMSDAGITIAITKHVSRDPGDSDSLLSGTAALSVGLGMAGYVIALAFVIVAGYPRVTFFDIAIAGLGLPFDALLTSVIGALDGRGRIVERAWISAFRTGLMAVGGAVALLLGSGVRGPIIATAVAPVVILLVTLPLARRWRIWWSRPRIDVARSRTLLRQALPFALVGVMGVLIMRFDVVLVSLLTTRAETALYDVATRSIEGVAYLGAVLGAPLMVVLSRRFGIGDRLASANIFAATCRAAWVIGLGLAAVIVGARVPLVHTLFGAGYADSVIPLALLAIQLPLRVITGQQGTVLAADSDERGLVIVSAWICATTIALDLVAVPLFDANGAAAVMVAVRVVAIVLFTIRVRREAGISTPRPPGGLMVAAVLAAVVGDRVAGLGMLVALTAAAATFAATALVSRGVRVSDLRDVRAAWSHPGG